MKTRIKIVHLKNGSKRYYPQWKGLFFWHYFREYMYDYSIAQSLNTLEEAQQAIDAFLIKEAARIGRKEIKTEYVKYP